MSWLLAFLCSGKTRFKVIVSYRHLCELVLVTVTVVKTYCSNSCCSWTCQDSRKVSLVFKVFFQWWWWLWWTDDGVNFTAVILCLPTTTTADAATTTEILATGQCILLRCKLRLTYDFWFVIVRLCFNLLTQNTEKQLLLGTNTALSSEENDWNGQKVVI